MLDNGRRRASLLATKLGRVVMLTRNDFLKLNLIDLVIQDTNNRKEILRRTGLFSDLTDQEFSEVGKVARFRQFERNTVILKQGDLPKFFVILVSGVCKVLQVRV